MKSQLVCDKRTFHYPSVELKGCYFVRNEEKVIMVYQIFLNAMDENGGSWHCLNQSKGTWDFAILHSHHHVLSRAIRT